MPTAAPTPPLDASSLATLAELQNSSEFIARHIGLSQADEQHMLQAIGQPSRAALMQAIVPQSIARTSA
ncbi:MAG: hypothetical protein ORN29_05880, partial [Rhodoferax sp.]|nr:hypothetical protein [Rhodoferax sp.]